MKDCTLYLIIFFLGCSLSSQSQTAFNLSTIEGLWQVVDSNGDPDYYVEIYEKDDNFYGKITKLFNREEPELLRCSNCDGDNQGQLIIGLDIITDMERGPTKYSKGRLLDYQKGRYSPCTIWMENEDIIRVRSWWLFFYKTAVWYRIS